MGNTNFKSNIEFMQQSFYIAWKNLTEYKTSFFAGIIIHTIWISANFFLVERLSSWFGNAINWDIIDFGLFWIIGNIMGCLIGFLTWGRNKFHIILLQGELNNYIVKPKNIFLNFIMNSLDSNAFIFLGINFLFFITLMLQIKFSLINFLLAFIIFISLLYTRFCIEISIESLAFFMLGLMKPVNGMYKRARDVADNYPAHFFGQNNYKEILFFIPHFFTGLLIIPILKGYPIWNLKLQLTIMFTSAIIFTLTLYILWHYGLKKYEAYN